MGGRLFGGADHGSQNVGLERRAWPLAQAVSGSVGSQGTATNVPALRVGTDRSWRSQEHSAFFFQAEDGIRHPLVTGVQTCALPIFGDLPRNELNVAIGRASL